MGPFETVFAKLTELEETVHEDLRVYTFRPAGQIQLPAMWNWLQGPSEHPQQDLAQWRDVLRINARIGVRHTDLPEDLLRLVRYVDAFVDAVDPALNHNPPLDNAAHWAARTAVGPTVTDRFNQVPVLAIDIPLEIRVDRLIPPT